MTATGANSCMYVLSVRQQQAQKVEGISLTYSSTEPTRVGIVFFRRIAHRSMTCCILTQNGSPRPQTLQIGRALPWTIGCCPRH